MKNNKGYTFFIKSTIDEGLLKKKFINLNWINKSKNVKICVNKNTPIKKNQICEENDRNYLPVDFYFVSGRFIYDRYMDQDPKGSIVVNKLDNEFLTTIQNKYFLYKYISDQSSEFYKYFCTPTIYVKGLKKLKLIQKMLDKFKILIVKPVGKYSGEGIITTNNINDIKNLIDANLETNYVIQNYIKDIFLLNKRKFHLRYNLLFIYKNNSDLEVYIAEKGRIVQAKEEYSLKNFYNKDVHDTHIDNERRLFPDAIKNILSTEQIDFINEQLELFMKLLIKNINKYKFENTKGTKVNFLMLGMDVLIKNNLNVKIIEINENPGFHDYFDHLMNHMILLTAGNFYNFDFKPDGLFRKIN
jgi:glutathione synthase/RimK-type ligase-like ATP-grasp enzyme